MEIKIRKYIEKLGNISNDINCWGGEAVVLRNLLKFSLPIPDGIVISACLYNEYESIKDKMVELDRFKINLNNIIRDSLERNQIRDDIIFRSSANIEGNEEICCSGIFDSYFHEKGMEYADTAIQVWNSAFDTETLNYISEAGFLEDLKMAIIVQPICRGEFSGVMQTYDIIKETNNAVIEYSSWRLEAVVDGTDNAERVILSDNGKIIDGLWKGNETALTELYNLGKKIESILGGVVEIEFVINVDSVYILQARILKG